MNLTKREWILLAKSIRNEYFRISRINDSMTTRYNLELLHATQNKMDELKELFKKVQDERIKQGGERRALDELSESND